MLNIIRVMITEDNVQIADSIRCFLETKPNVKVVAMAVNGDQAITMLGETSPDIIILDLVMPNSDGFVVLKHLANAQYDSKPKVIVLSAVFMEEIIKKACELGAAYYLIKPFNLGLLYDRLCMLHNDAGVAPEPAFKIEDSLCENSVEAKLRSVFLTIGIPGHLKGYQYLFAAVKLALHDPSVMDEMMKKLYPMIAEQYATTPANIERSIRHVIKIAGESGKLEKLNIVLKTNVCSKNSKPPANGEFIYLMANAIQLE